MRFKDYLGIGAFAATVIAYDWSTDETVEVAPATASAKRAPKEVKSPEEIQREEMSRKFEEWLSRSSDPIDREDTCLPITEDYMEAYSDGADKEELRAIKDDLEACRADLPSSEAQASERNFRILESQVSYEKGCGGEKAEACKGAQEEVATHLQRQGESGWNYSDEIEWAFDEDGQIRDVAAFPGYQKYIHHGDHDDLLSISVSWNKDGDPIYGFGISYQGDASSTPVVWGKGASTISDLYLEIAEITSAEADPVAAASHD